MTIYLAGPMTGYKDHNHVAFAQAAAALRAWGHHVISPAETAGGASDMDRAFYMRVDMAYLSNVDRVIVLPGWRDSPGAKLEVIFATATGLPINEFCPELGIGRPVMVEDWTVKLYTESCL